MTTLYHYQDISNLGIKPPTGTTTLRPGLGDIVNDPEAPPADIFETPYPSPPDLENPPPHHNDDGFSFLKDLEFHVNHNEHPTTQLLGNQISNPISQDPGVSSCLHQPLINVINKLDTPPDASLLHTPILAPLPKSQPSPRNFAQEEYFCLAPGCTWTFPFPTKQGLTRHYEVVHREKRLDCPIPGCKNVGNRGIKREDNLRTHVWTQHRVKLPRKSRRTTSVGQ